MDEDCTTCGGCGNSVWDCTCGGKVQEINRFGDPAHFNDDFPALEDVSVYEPRDGRRRTR
jgi:hypothetical protein